MTKLKTIASCLVLLTTVAYEFSAAAPQHEAAQRVKSLPQEPAKRPAPPAFTQTTDYIVEPTDLVDIRVAEALPGRPISGERLVRPDGKICLGFYGEVDAAGLTLAEIKTKVISRLQKLLRDDALGLVVLDANGEPVVDPATGKPRRIDPKDSKRVRVEVTQCNSKCFYVQGEVWGPGRFPFTGTETVLDAIKMAGGSNPSADMEQVLLYRQGSRGELECLTVDVNQVQHGKIRSTDSTLKPGDRVVVRRRAADGRGAEAIGPRPSQARSQPHAVAPEQDAGDQQLELGREDLSLEHVEKRMTDLERKLDLILEAINRPRS
jgi:polysaccharide biosynthesis/export protein